MVGGRIHSRSPLPRHGSSVCVVAEEAIEVKVYCDEDGEYVKSERKDGSVRNDVEEDWEDD